MPGPGTRARPRPLGRRAEARRILGEVYQWFTEGFETTDLRAARAVLDDLDAGVPAPTRSAAS